jgi:hypothetical protein
MGAAAAIGLIRPAAKSATPALLRAMKDPDEGVRRNASYALSRITGPKLIVASSAGDRFPDVPPPDPTPGGTP